MRLKPAADSKGFVVEQLQRGVSVVVPVYNSEASLGELVQRLSDVLPEVSGDGGWEIILVNDGSKDGSWSVAARLAAEHEYVRSINLMRNYGQHNALLCGIRRATFDTCVTIDDDLQHPPELVPELLRRLTDDVDVVYGTPEKQQHGVFRDAASYMTKLALRGTMGVVAARGVSAFRAFRTDLRRAFETYSAPFLSIDVLLTWATDRFAVVAVRHESRTQGKSNYTVQMLLTHALNMITGYTTLPLRLASWIGFSFTLLGIIALLYVVGRYLIEGGAVPGFAFLASLISIFSGATLFSLGIMGEYLARMHTRLMEKPAYVVRASLRRDGEGEHADPVA